MNSILLKYASIIVAFFTFIFLSNCKKNDDKDCVNYCIKQAVNYNIEGDEHINTNYFYNGDKLTSIETIFTKQLLRTTDSRLSISYSEKKVTFLFEERTDNEYDVVCKYEIIIQENTIIELISY